MQTRVIHWHCECKMRKVGSSLLYYASLFICATTQRPERLSTLACLGRAEILLLPFVTVAFTNFALAVGSWAGNEQRKPNVLSTINIKGKKRPICSLTSVGCRMVQPNSVDPSEHGRTQVGPNLKLERMGNSGRKETVKLPCFAGSHPGKIVV